MPTPSLFQPPAGANSGAGVNGHHVDDPERLHVLDDTFRHIKLALIARLAEHHVHVSADSLLLAIRQRRQDEGAHYFVQILEPLCGTAVLLWTQTEGLRILLQEFTLTQRLRSSDVSPLGSRVGGNVLDEETPDPTIRMGTPVALPPPARSGRTGPIPTGLSPVEMAEFLSGETMLRQFWLQSEQPTSATPAAASPVSPPATPEPSQRERRVLRL